MVARKTTRRKTKKQGKAGGVLDLEWMGVEPITFTRAMTVVFGVIGFSIGLFLVLLSLLIPYVPGMPEYAPGAGSRLVLTSVVITFVLAIFYSMMGGLLGNLGAKTFNTICGAYGGIKLRFKRLN